MAAKKKEEKNQAQEYGFELNGEFYPWFLTDTGKDLMLIDRITGGMLPYEFFDAANDPREQMRGPIRLGLIATSIRHRHPDWTVERILRLTMDTNLSDFEFIGGEDAEEDANPPASADGEDSPESSAKSNGSQEGQSETLLETPA